MKKLYILLFALVGINSAMAQGCLPEGIIFYYQSQIDSFPINYPGCTEIEGDVSISDDYWGNGSDISNLNGLNSITTVGGNFTVWGCDTLRNLMGLENLTSVAGGLILNGNYAMTSLTGLESLTSVGGELWIGFCYGCGGTPELKAGNPKLASISSFENLTTVGGDLQIGDNSTLPSLAGLSNLTSVGGSLYIFSNDSLADLAGLENLSSINGELIIANNNALTSLMGLENLSSIAGNLSINSNNALTNLSGITNIDPATIENLRISHNYSLSSCGAQSICDYLVNPNGTVDIYNNAEGCNNPSQIATGCGNTIECLPYGNYYFFTQDDIANFQTDYPGCVDLKGNITINGSGIADLSGLIGLSSIEGNIGIGNYNYGTSLTNLSGLDSLDFIGGNFIIRKNSNLDNLSGLENLNFVAGDLTISTNNSLSKLTGLENLDSIGGSLGLSNNYFDNLQGLNALKYIGGGFGISGAGDYDYHLVSLAGLDSLSSIGGSIGISYTNLLTDLSGLSGVTSIGGNLNLFANHSLTNLTGLDNIEPASISKLVITYNNSLSICEVQSICHYLASPTGTIDIYSNAPGCDSPEEVETACEAVGVENAVIENGVFIFPNPANQSVTFTTKHGSIIDEVTIYNQTGQIVYRGVPENNTLDISKLQPGMYVVEVVTKDGNVRRKLIIQ